MKDEGMSQEDIDKLLNGETGENSEGVKSDKQGDEINISEEEGTNEGISISQEQIDSLLKNTMDEQNSKEFTQDNIDTLVRRASNNMSQEDLDKIIQKAKENGAEEIHGEKSQIDLMEEEKRKRENLVLTNEEKNVISELMTISYSEASTALTALLGQSASIKNPIVEELNKTEIKDGSVSYVIVKIHYTKGLELENTLVFRKEDAFYMSDAMMGNPHNIDDAREMNEMEFSAIKEAINQMIGKSATAMYQVLQRTVDISPPEIKVAPLEDEIQDVKGKNNKVIRVSMDLEMNDIQSKVWQLMSVESAKKMAQEILKMRKQEEQDEEKEELITNQSGEDSGNSGKRDINALFRNVEVKMELVYGTTRKTLKEFLSLDKNDVIELSEEVYEPLKLYANGILVAEGDLVNADGYYGVKIQRIL
ncbi:FliM/FliN family flagellar motor switch protein [Priestia filamentosa]|uniref:FliM/FliN family flagellar motor switch protein n=1 Tax=Priestia filamentosa TaxID=1402861 RepID=UPI00397D676F